MCVLGLSALMAWASPAQAECPAAYTPQQLTADIGAMTAALRSLDETTFRATGAQMEARLPCIGKKLPAAVYANIYRYIGAYHYLDKDYQAAGRWFRTALELDPNFDWDVNDLGPGHPLRGHFDAQRNVAVVDPEARDGFELNVPAGSQLILDGRVLKAPAATVNRPHLLQVVATADGTVRQAFVIEGNELPDAFLKAASATDTVADSGNGRRNRNTEALGEEVIDGFRVVTLQRVRPPAKTPLMVAGSAGVLVGAGLYAVSYMTHQEFQAASTTDDMLRYQSLTNALVVGSGAMVAVGVGVGYAGVMMDGGSPGVVFGGRF